MAGLDARRQRRGIGIVKHDEVDVARIVELEGALLAHGQHRCSRSPAMASTDRQAQAGQRHGPRAASQSTAACRLASAKRVSAAVTSASGQRPPVSAIAISNAALALAARKAAMKSVWQVPSATIRSPAMMRSSTDSGSATKASAAKSGSRQHQVAQIGRRTREAIEEIRTRTVAQCIGGMASRKRRTAAVVERRWQPRCDLSGHGGLV